MTGRGFGMSPRERYLRSVYLVYQVCTDVLRHYFDDKNPPDRLVQDLLDKRPEFEKGEKKIPNYQLIQLYPEALFRADIKIVEKYIEPCDKTDYKEFAHRMKTIFEYVFDTVDGDQEVKLVKTTRVGPDEVLTSFEISSRYNPDGCKIKEALEQLVNGGKVDASLEISSSSDGCQWDKQGDIFTMVIHLTKEFNDALRQKDSLEFKMMAKKIERILHFLYDSVPGSQLFQVGEFRSLPSSNCISAICTLTSKDLKNEKKLKDLFKRNISEGRLRKALTTTCSQNGFSFKEVIVFESEIKVHEKFSKHLANSDHPDFKALVDRVQPIIKGLYASSIGEQDVEIVRFRRDENPDTMFVVFHLISHGNNDEEELRKVTEKAIRTGSLSLSYGITADGFRFKPYKCMFNVKVKLAEKKEDYKLLANPTSKAFKSFKEKVEPDILRLYDQIDGVQEIDIDKYKIESSGAAHFIIFKLTSRDCSDESTLKEPIETQIQTGLLGSSLKVSRSDMVFQKLAEKVIYQVSLNVEVQFQEKLKTKHSAEFMAFSKFVQTVLNTHYKYDEKVSGRQDGHVIECRQGPTVSSTNVILEIISHECTNEEVVRQSIENLIAVGKLDSTLKTSATDFTFKIVRGSKPVSSKCFDLSLMINLLRRQMSEPGTFDDLPPKEDISDVAQIARIKYYRNECIAHVSDTDMSEHKFEDLWSDLENAINHLGKGANQFATVVKDALSMKLDNFTCETYTKMVNKDMPLNRRKIDKIELPKSFVKIQEVDKADVLGDKGILILVGNKGSGKSTIGMANIKQYCDRNQAYDFIQLSTTTKSNIQNFDRLGFFRPNSSRRNVVVFLDDLFGRIPSKYAFRDHLMLLKWVNNKKDEFDVKILLTVQAETKECFEELFTNDTLLSTTDILNLDSIINRLDHVDILRGIGINEERAAEYKKQMVRTEENQIGCFALFSLFKKNKELWNELFANPKEAFMKYLSSLLQEGDTENNMYYVILIQVCMTGEILARLSHREKKLMGKIVEVLFNSKLDFENDVSVKRIMARQSKKDGILMIKKDPNYPGYFYCFEQEVTREFIFQHYKAKGIERILTTCSLSCIVSYFRPLPDKADEPFVNIDSSIYQKVAIQIIRIIRKNLKTSVSDAISSVKTLCMSPLLQDENFLMELMIACDKLLKYRYSVFAQTETFNFGYDKIDSLEAFHFPSLLLYQSFRQLSMMYGENVKVVKTIFQKVSDSREANKDHVEISQTINKLVRFSMEELCKENNDVNAALKMLWKFIIDNGVNCQYNDFLMNALRNQCPQTVNWLRENVIEPNCLQMEKCFIEICLIPDVDKADWFLEHVRENRTEQNPFNLYGAFKEALHRNSESLMKVIWKWEERILEDYRHLYPDIDIENSKKKIANMVMDISLNEQNIRTHSEIFSWANDIFKPHSKYFEKNLMDDIEEHEREHVTRKITFT